MTTPSKEALMRLAVKRATEELREAENERMRPELRYGCVCLGLWFLDDCEHEIAWERRRYDPETWDVRQEELDTLIERLRLKLQDAQAANTMDRAPTDAESKEASRWFMARAREQGLID